MFKCGLCTKTFGHPSRLDRHMFTHTKEKPHKCLICSEAFGVVSDLKRHIKVVHDGIQRTRNKNHHCTMCSYKCYAKSLLQIHVRKHSADLPFSCHRPGCGFQTKYKSGLSQHAFHAHSDKRPFKCPSDGCSYKSKSSTNVTRHLKVHSTEKPFVCTIPGCTHTCKSQSTLKRHTSTVHSNERPFKCSVCDFRANVKDDLTKHQITHQKIKRFQCQAANCGFASHTRSNLNVHFDRKHRTNEVLCTKRRCNFRCSSIALLEEHLKRHKLPMLKCPGDSCGFRTKYKHSLREHISRRHKGFQSSVTVVGNRISYLKTDSLMNTLHCSFTDCNFQTKFRQLYDRHVISHKKEVKGLHVCSFCFSTFSKPSILKAHLQTHIREKPFSCSHCSYTAMTSVYLKRHARKIHFIHVIPCGKEDEWRKCRTCDRCCWGNSESVLHSMSHLQPVVVLEQLKLRVL